MILWTNESHSGDKGYRAEHEGFYIMTTTRKYLRLFVRNEAGDWIRQPEVFRSADSAKAQAERLLEGSLTA